jgi:hypothetical protein
MRGDYNLRGEEVQPAVPVVLGKEQSIMSRRADLAAWLTSRQDPLTARVMANRIWKHHFGRGLVATPSDFGLQGQRPTHPELLDWLANEFVRSGWSIKHMHRLILLSSVYQQSAEASDVAREKDPHNRLYTRRDRVRLEGEAIRDSLLAISGRLNREMHGPSVFPPIPEDVFKGARGWEVTKNPASWNRRSIYIFARRNLRFPFLEVFDAPDSNLSCPERLRSVSAPQSLTLLNAEEVMTGSKAVAEMLIAAGGSDEERIGLAYRLILGRSPTAKERELAIQFLETAPWSELCRALLNLNGFAYVE